MSLYKACSCVAENFTVFLSVYLGSDPTHMLQQPLPPLLLQKKEVAAAAPHVDAQSWPDAARRYLSLVATARRLSLTFVDNARAPVYHLALPPPLILLESEPLLRFMFAGINDPTYMSRCVPLKAGIWEGREGRG